jgi:class 3 adenylate cyclase
MSLGRAPSMCNLAACLTWRSAGVSVDPAAAAPPGVVTFMFTNVDGSTRRWESDAQAMRAALVVQDKVGSGYGRGTGPGNRVRIRSYRPR